MKEKEDGRMSGYYSDSEPKLVRKFLTAWWYVFTPHWESKGGCFVLLSHQRTQKSSCMNCTILFILLYFILASLCTNLNFSLKMKN